MTGAWFWATFGVEGVRMRGLGGGEFFFFLVES